MLESTKKTQENISPYPVARKGFRTLSHVRLKELLSQLKSKKKGGNQPQNNLNSSLESKPMAELQSLRIRLTMYWVLFKNLPKAIFLWTRFKLAKRLLDWRNKPMSILIYPDPRLKRIAEPVDFKKINYKQRSAIVRKLGVALAKQTYGMKLGISAPQIGIDLQIMTVQGAVIFNPKWNPVKAPPNIVTEGCYSVPNKLYKVNRAPYGWAHWKDINNIERSFKLKGLDAIIFTHELDHLNGRCLPDYGEEIKDS